MLLGAFLGILFRFLIPFLRKVKAGEIAWRDIDQTYVVEAVLAFFTAYLTVFALVEGGTLPAFPWALFLVAFVAGVGQMEMLNELIKVVATFEKKEE